MPSRSASIAIGAMPELLIAAVGFGLAQVILSLVLLARQPAWGMREWLFALLMLAILGYLLMPPAAGTVWAPFMATLQTLAPGMFWLFAASSGGVREDRGRETR